MEGKSVTTILDSKNGSHTFLTTAFNVLYVRPAQSRLSQDKILQE